MSRLRNFVFRRKFSIYVQYLPHAVCDPATCHHHHIWFGIFRIFFRGFSILLSIPCSSLCSSWSALKIAYFVFAFVHVFYPTRTHGRRHCQSTYCYSCCAVRNTSAAHVPPPFGIPTLIHTSSLIHKLKVRILTRPLLEFSIAKRFLPPYTDAYSGIFC